MTGEVDQFDQVLVEEISDDFRPKVRDHVCRSPDAIEKKLCTAEFRNRNRAVFGTSLGSSS
jgi:hypothetical protein